MNYARVFNLHIQNYDLYFGLVYVQQFNNKHIFNFTFVDHYTNVFYCLISKFSVGWCQSQTLIKICFIKVSIKTVSKLIESSLSYASWLVSEKHQLFAQSPKHPQKPQTYLFIQTSSLLDKLFLYHPNKYLLQFHPSHACT